MLAFAFPQYRRLKKARWKKESTDRRLNQACRLEQLPPLTYLSASYYQRWLLGMEKNIIERGLATAEELKAGHATTAGKMLGRKLTVSVFQATRPSYFRQQQAPARFKPGDRVRARNIHPKNHTRLPRYARGKLDTRAFWDYELMWPYLKAYQAQKAVHDQEARMQLMVALGQEAPIGA